MISKLMPNAYVLIVLPSVFLMATAFTRYADPLTVGRLISGGWNKQFRICMCTFNSLPTLITKLPKGQQKLTYILCDEIDNYMEGEHINGLVSEEET